MKAQFGTIVGKTAFGTHFKWFVATIAKFIFTLTACEMHATPSVQKCMLNFQLKFIRIWPIEEITWQVNT